MDTFVARLLQPTLAAFAVLVAALVVLVIAVGMAMTPASGVDSISIAMTDSAPFRWA